MKRSSLLWALAALLSACAGMKMNHVQLDSALNLSQYEGKAVELKGRISDIPWQHMIGNPDGYNYSEYFDVADFQIVIYSKQPLECAGELTVRGTVVRIQGSSKRPRETKADETYVEYHLAVDEWDCR